jgi:hypothetical protein
MKNTVITLFLFLLFIPAFSQNSRSEYGLSPAIKKEKLKEAKLINDIMPDFSRYFVLPHKERILFDEQLKLASSLNGYHIYPQELLNRSPEKYNWIIYFVSVELLATCNGKFLTAKSESYLLTEAQKNILNTADLGSDIRVKIKFIYKNQANVNMDNFGDIREGEYVFAVVPETEAEYPGGFKQMTDYLTKNVIDKISKKDEKLWQTAVKFTIDEVGQVVDTKISKTSTDPKTDKLLLDALNKMPRWKPAKNTKGLKVKQEFNIPLGGNGC